MNISEQNFKLSHHMWSKRRFDVRSSADLDEYAYFREHNKWRSGCPFHLEWPYLNISDMIKDKIIGEYLEFIQEVTEDAEQ